MAIIDNKFVREMHFPSLNTLLMLAEKRSAVPDLSIHECSSREKPDSDYQAKWYGSKSFEDFMAVTKRGWPEGSQRIHEMTKKYAGIFNKIFPTQDFSQETYHDVSGETVDIGKFLDNVPEHMMGFKQDIDNFDNLIKGGRLQRLIVNVACNCHVDSKTIYARNSLICALCNAMELYGFRIEINLAAVYDGNSFSGNIGRMKFFATLKNFDSDINVDKLAIGLSHPSIQRRAIFSLMETEGESDEENRIITKQFIRNSYGHAVNLTEDEIKNFGVNKSQVLNNCNLYFDRLDDNYTIEQMAEQFTQKLKEHFNLVSFNKDGGDDKDKDKGQQRFGKY